MDRHFWGSCRVGPGLGRIFRIFSAEIVLEGLRTISWGSGGRFWGQLFVFGPWKVSLIFQVTPSITHSQQERQKGKVVGVLSQCLWPTQGEKNKYTAQPHRGNRDIIGKIMGTQGDIPQNEKNVPNRPPRARNRSKRAGIESPGQYRSPRCHPSPGRLLGRLARPHVPPNSVDFVAKYDTNWRMLGCRSGHIDQLRANPLPECCRSR